MTTETKKEKLKRYIATILTSTIAGVLTTMIVSFFQINPLKDNIQEQNTTIQTLKQNVILLESTIQLQNTQINQIKAYIETNYGPITVN